MILSPPSGLRGLRCDSQLSSLEGSAPLAKAPRGHSGTRVFGARGCPSWSPPPPPSPSWLRLSTPGRRGELRYLTILLLPPAPAERLCRSRRVPVSHAEGREGGASATGPRLAVVRRSRARGGPRSDAGRRFRGCEGAGAASPAGRAPGL